MSDTLYRYYEEELVSFRQESREFSQRYPSAAGSLQLEYGQSADPHVERLIESFAFLNARTRKKLDDDFPELTDGLLSILYPHFLAPIPSMTTLQFAGEPANLLPTGLRIPRHNAVRMQSADDIACRFRTCYPVELWPIDVAEANLLLPPFTSNLEIPADVEAALTLRLVCTGGMRFDDLSLQNLRLHIDGNSHLVGKLYELIFNQTVRVAFCATHDTRREREIIMQPRDCIQAVGFDAQEAILPYPKNSFLGFQLLTELFSFPSKFAYFDLGGFGEVSQARLGNQIDVTFYLSSVPPGLEQEINHRTFRLGCTPVVNLFSRNCEPIRLSHKKYKYSVVPDIHHPQGMEVYSIDAVKSADPHTQRNYQPFYSFQRSVQAGGSEAYWYASRTESLLAGDSGTDVQLHFVDPHFDVRLPAETALTVHATCSNRELPVRLQANHQDLNFELEAAIPVRSIECLQHLTAPLRAPMKRKAHWSLVSHLTLNHLSITNSEDGLDSLRHMLSLYDFADPKSSSKRAAINHQMVEGIAGISNRRITRRIGEADSSAFCRGLQISLELDEEKYIGVGAFLFSSVIRHFFTKYASINSFVELLVTSKQRAEPIRHWPPLLGEEGVS